MKRLDSCKKGVVADTMILTIVGFMVAVFLVISFIVFNEINIAVEATPALASGAPILGNYIDDYVDIWDFSYTILFYGLILAGLIFVFLVDTTPLFYFFAWFASMAIFITAAALGNAYGVFSLDPSVVSAATQFTLINFTMSHYLEIMIIVTGLYVVAFFTKGRGIA